MIAVAVAVAIFLRNFYSTPPFTKKIYKFHGLCICMYIIINSFYDDVVVLCIVYFLCTTYL
jgi:hypothetical protein